MSISDNTLILNMVCHPIILPLSIEIVTTSKNNGFGPIYLFSYYPLNHFDK